MYPRKFGQPVDRGLIIYYPCKNIKKLYKINKISAQKWKNKFGLFDHPKMEDKFGLFDQSYSITDAQDYFEYIIRNKKNWMKISPTQIYVFINKVEK